MAHSSDRKLSGSPLTSPLFLTGSVLFLLNQAIECLGLYIPYLHSYLDDLLCIPLVLSITLYIQKNFTLRNPLYKFSGLHIAITVLYFTIVFEWLLPEYASRYTADGLDVLAYMTGGFIFYRWMNR